MTTKFLNFAVKNVLSILFDTLSAVAQLYPYTSNKSVLAYDRIAHKEVVLSSSCHETVCHGIMSREARRRYKQSL